KGQAAKRSKWPRRWTATYGDKPKTMAATTAARLAALRRATSILDPILDRSRIGPGLLRGPRMLSASAYMQAMFANTYAISRTFCAAATERPRKTVAATKAGSAVCG